MQISSTAIPSPRSTISPVAPQLIEMRRGQERRFPGNEGVGIHDRFELQLQAQQVLVLVAECVALQRLQHPERVIVRETEITQVALRRQWRRELVIEVARPRGSIRSCPR